MEKKIKIKAIAAGNAHAAAISEDGQVGLFRPSTPNIVNSSIRWVHIMLFCA